MNVNVEGDSILIDENEYEKNAIEGLQSPRQPIDKELHEKYNKRYLILLNSSSPISENGQTKLFWSKYFRSYVSSEW